MQWLRRYGDLSLAALLAVGWVVELASYHPADYPTTAAVGVAAALTVAVRRRVPLASFAVMIGLFAVSGRLDQHYAHDGLFPLAVFMISLYSLGANTRGLEARLALVGVGAGIAGIASDNWPVTVGSMFFYCIFCALPWGAGLAVRLRGERVRDLEARSEALREQAEQAVAEERTRIARELHDVVSHAIAVTVLQSRGAEKLVGRDDHAVTDALRAIEQTNTSALTDMRRLLTLLRSQGHTADSTDTVARDEPAPTLDRIDRLVDQVRASGLPVDLTVVGDPLPVPPGLDLSAYRIVQEALTNVLKHGGPHARATVRVQYDAACLAVEVSNTGRTGAGPGSPGGHGLAGIRERVAVTGGTVEAGPTAAGFAVRARMPYLVAAP